MSLYEFGVAFVSSLMTMTALVSYRHINDNRKQRRINSSSTKTVTSVEFDLKKTMVEKLNVYSNNLLTESQQIIVDRAVTVVFPYKYNESLLTKEHLLFINERDVPCQNEKWPIIRRGIANKLKEYGFPAEEHDSAVFVSKREIQKELEKFAEDHLKKETDMEPVAPHSEGVYR